MRKISKRSDSSVNRVHIYSAIDARIDNPHLTMREIPGIVREANEIRRTYRPLRARLRQAV